MQTFPLMRSTLTIWLTNTLHIAICLLSNRSQMTSHCGKNKEVTHEAKVSVSGMFLPHFDVFCNPLLNKPMAKWNLFVLNKYYKHRRKNDSLPDIHCTALLFQGLCQFRHFLSHKHYFSSLLLHLTCIQFIQKVF